MIAVAVASRAVGEVSIYRSQLRDRLEGREVHETFETAKAARRKKERSADGAQ